MGYPERSVVSTGPVPQESVTSVLVNSLETLSAVENRLHQLRDRIEPRPVPTDKLNPGAMVSQGALHTAMDIRNVSSRLVDRCAELEALLG